MRLCDIVQFYSPLSGGVKRYINDKRGFYRTQPDIRHLLIVPAEQTRLTHDGHTVVFDARMPMLPGSASYRILLPGPRTVRILKRFSPDLIEVGDPYFSGWVGLLVGRRLGIPVISFYHSEYPRALSRTVEKYLGRRPAALTLKLITVYLRFFYGRTDSVIVATRRFQRILNDSGVRRVVYVPLGTDPQRFFPRANREAVRRRLGIPPGHRLLIYAGRIAREKSIKHLVSMIERLHSRRQDLCLLVVGDGELCEWVREAALTRRWMQWHPYCNSADDLAELYTAADLMTHASMTETFGLTALEAQACGTPVVAFRHSGMDEVLESIPGNRLVPTGDEAAFIAAASQLIDNPPDADVRWLRHARVAELYACDETAQRIVSLYKERIEANRRAIEIRKLHLAENRK